MLEKFSFSTKKPDFVVGMNGNNVSNLRLIRSCRKELHQMRKVLQG